MIESGQVNSRKKKFKAGLEFNPRNYSIGYNNNYFEEFEVSGLRFAIANNILVYPLAIPSGTGSVRGGIVPFKAMPPYFNQQRMDNGDYVSINRFRHGDATAVPSKDNPVCQLDGTYLFVGPLHNHIGHFILETSQRMWLSSVLKRCFGLVNHKFLLLPECKTVAERESFSLESLPDWQLGVLRHFSPRIAKNIHFLKKPTLVEKLIIAEQGFLWGSASGASSNYLQLLKKYVNGYKIAKSSQKTRKLFILRGKRYLTQGYAAGEEYLADFFEMNGYDVIDPVNLPFQKRYNIFLETDIAFGVQASSFHVFNLVGDGRVSIGWLKRVANNLSAMSVTSLVGFAQKIEVLDYSNVIQNTRTGGSTNNLCLFEDVEMLLSFFKQLDPEIDTSIFDEAQYKEAVSKDVSSFLEFLNSEPTSDSE